MTLIELLEKIPATFWGVIVGSFFSILGVWLTNRSSSDRLLKQFEHERAVKSNERELSIKKDIYLEAAEAISVAISTLSNLANLDVSNDKVSERYLERSPALAKVQVVGNMDTVSALADLTTEFSTQYLRLFATRHQLNSQKNQLTVLDSRAAVIKSDVDRFSDLLKQHLIGGEPDQKKIDALLKHIDFEQKNYVQVLEQRNQLGKEVGSHHIKFMEECSKGSMAVSALIPPLLMAVRTELELPLQLDIYQASVDRSLAKQTQSRDKYLRTISAPFKQD